MRNRPEVENVTIVEEGGYTNSVHPLHRTWLVFAGFISAFTIVVGVILALVFIRQWLIGFMIVLLTTIATLPVLGVIYCVARLYKYIRQPQIVRLDPTGTLFHRGNNVQVFSTNEVYAFETKDAPPVLPQIAQNTSVQFDYRYAPREAMPTLEELHYRNTASLEETAKETAVYYIPTEAGQETHIQSLPVDEVLDVLESEKEAAKSAMDAQQRELTKARIVQFRKMNVPHRQIAPLVKLGGNKYKQYQELCRELGMNE